MAESVMQQQEIFDDKEKALIQELLTENQEHLFSKWPKSGTEDTEKKSFVKQLIKIDESIQGGLISYIKRAKKLLEESKNGQNPLDGYIPNIPKGVKLDFCSTEYNKMEEIGIKEAYNSAFVLVAGGLGERLGYSGIKISLPCDSVRNISFLQLYIEYILAIQKRGQCENEMEKNKKLIPLVIMTSDDTHEKTIRFLEENKNFGMAETQVIIIKQEKVPCFRNNEAHLSIDKTNPYVLETKPHGHGDVHALLYEKRLPEKWEKEGIKWICFFQDTNALLFNGLLAALGVSADNDWDVNSLTIPRKAKEAIGAIVQLKNNDTGRDITLNVEYNQLDPLLKNTSYPDGDVNDETGYSPFPGNVNQLIFKINPYVIHLNKTKGLISEFVNPKYKDETKEVFLKSTRLECMMQDYPKTLDSDATVGFTSINQEWSTYSPVKNSAITALNKFNEGCPPHSAASGELDIYKSNSKKLEYLGCQIGKPLLKEFCSIQFCIYPKIVWSPKFALTFEDLKKKILEPHNFIVNSNSTLIIDSCDVEIKKLHLDGTLLIKTESGTSVSFDNFKVVNDGWDLVKIPENSEEKEEISIRGFNVLKNDAKEIIVSDQKKHVFNNVD